MTRAPLDVPERLLLPDSCDPVPRRSVHASRCLVALLPPYPAAQTRPVTVDDILDLKGVGSPMVSPDGTRVLYTVRGWEAPSDREPDQRESRMHIWMVPASGGAPARQITFGQRGDFAAAVVAGWPAHQLRVGPRQQRRGRDRRPQLYVMRADGGEALARHRRRRSVPHMRGRPTAAAGVCRHRSATPRKRRRSRTRTTSACSRTSSGIGICG